MNPSGLLHGFRADLADPSSSHLHGCEEPSRPELLDFIQTAESCGRPGEGEATEKLEIAPLTRIIHDA
jgi:hypothetical protein